MHQPTDAHKAAYADALNAILMINLLRDEFTDDEIAEFVREHHNVIGVSVTPGGISVNRQTDNSDAYGWQRLSDEQVVRLRCAMRLT